MLNIQLLQGYLLLSSKKKSCELTTNAKKSKRLLKITDRAESDTSVEVCKSQTQWNEGFSEGVAGFSWDISSIFILYQCKALYIPRKNADA